MTLHHWVLPRNRRDYFLSYVLASIANILILVPQYGIVRQSLSVGVPVPEPVRGLTAVYGSGVGIEAGILIAVLVFQLVTLGFLLWIRMWQRSKRWKYALASALLVGYVGLAIGYGFISSLEWIAALQNANVDVSSLWQNLYPYNLGAAICYTGLVLLLRRSYSRLSGLEGLKLIEPSSAVG